MSSFKGKTIVVTGAGMGLGLATAKVLAAKGANLSLVDYNEKALADAKSELQSIAPDAKILTIIADTSNEEAVKAYVDQTVSEFGTIDGFYNNAGIEGKQAPLTEYDVETNVSTLTDRQLPSMEVNRTFMGIRKTYLNI